MSNDLTTFTFGGDSVRVVHIADQPWWAAADLARVLGYRDAHDMVRKLDDDQKGTHKMRTLGGDQEATIVNESGMWTCVIRSNRPEAKAFQRLLTSEILPALRRQGYYALPGATIARPASIAEFLRVGNALKKETNRKQRAELWERRERILDSWGHPRSERTGIGYDAPDYDDILAAFWAAVRCLEELGIAVNQSLRNDVIALNLPDLRAKFLQSDVPIEIGRGLTEALRHSESPRFIAEKTVRCSDGKTRFCWVFNAVAELPLLQ